MISASAIKLLKQAGADENDIITARCKYRSLSAEYTDFCDKMNLPQERQRVYSDGLGNIGTGRTKSVANSENMSYNIKSDTAQFERYKKVLGKNSPATLEEFIRIKHNDPEKWNELKYQYRTVNRYEVDGDVSADKILELDNAAYYTKKKGFDYSGFSGKEKRKIINDISNGGNVATMELDGKIYFSHSKFELSGSFEHSLYKGKYQAITLSDKRIFKVIDLGDGIPRQYDTEAKLLEFVATQKKPTDEFTVTILSEKHICESCQGVVEQFKKMYPNATVNIVSGKRNYNGSPEGLHTWKHRKKVK